MKSRHWLASISGLALLVAAPLSAQRERAEGPSEVLNEAAPVQAEDDAADISDFSNLDDEDFLAELRAEIEAEWGVLGELFKTEPLTKEQEARLPLAKSMTDEIFPVGTFGTIMQDAMDPLFSAIMGAVASDPRIRLSAVTGVEASELADLSDSDAQEALDIFDPGFASRTEKLGDVMVEMIGRLFDAIEPSYRDAMARALTTRFDEAEMREALTVLENPVASKLAKQAFLVQYDPQMLAVMEQMGPAMMEVMPGMMEEFAEVGVELEDEGRNFGELSAAERERAARLLGKSENELEALTPETEEVEVEEEEPVI